MKRLIFKFYAPIIIVGFILLIATFINSDKSKDDISLFVTIAAGLIGFFYFAEEFPFYRKGYI